MIWQYPYLTAVHTGAEVRGVRLPDGWSQLAPLQAERIRYLPQAARSATCSSSRKVCGSASASGDRSFRHAAGTFVLQ
ncbi:hypothetical protein KNP414_06034 [Paenibacillus mucilaginosus KNP414]|uniref:Uncharacterized protein n=1 Tax=Paenibacillus mucilaginosus (strain KNP414) TaxID=1036673 RepID=F8FEF9_PAEMK|nr:hypothetical protein KNP414_06034 [Paenibacillus mucilaginosus KNP414]